MLQKLLHILFSFSILIFIVPVTGKIYAACDIYVSPSGSSSGSGSISSPVDIRTALSKSTLTLPGCTVWLRGGTYDVRSPRLDASINGTAANPIIVKQYKGERAIVNGGINGNGSYVHFWGFEITNTNSRHVGKENCGSYPHNSTKGPGLAFYGGPGYKAINLVMYNTGHPGIAAYAEAISSELYGNIIWGSGIYHHCWLDQNDPSQYTARGSTWYTQSNGEPRLISDNIAFRNLRTGGKSYGDAVPANGFTYDGNVSFSNGDDQLAIDSIDNDITDLTFKNNYTYRRADDPNGVGTIFGLWVSGTRRNRGLIMQNNYLVNNTRADLGTVSWKNWSAATISNNTIVSRGAAADWWLPANTTGVTWSNNKFYTPSPSSRGFIYLDPHTSSDHSPYIHNVDFSSWASKVGASTGSNTATAGIPTQNAIFVRRNKYEPCRGNIIVYNWQRTPSVSVDISGSGIVGSGHRYKVIDAQNYFGPTVAQGTYSGGSITIPMNLTAVSQITELTNNSESNVPNIHTASGTNEFAVFVLVDTDNINCSAPSPTGGTSPNPLPQPTNITGQTGISIQLLLHGIGKGGDNVNPAAMGTSNPLRPQRQVTIELTDANNNISSRQETITYNSSQGNFSGTVTFNSLTSGVYTVKVVSPQYLRKSAPGIITISQGSTTTLPTITLTTGNTNNDTVLSILDYNIILDCFSDFGQPRNCADSTKKQNADITDDGNVDQFDYNLFLRELSVQSGE